MTQPTQHCNGRPGYSKKDAKLIATSGAFAQIMYYRCKTCGQYHLKEKK